MLMTLSSWSATCVGKLRGDVVLAGESAPAGALIHRGLLSLQRRSYALSAKRPHGRPRRRPGRGVQMREEPGNDADDDEEPDHFGVEPDPDDPAHNADPDDVHGKYDHPESA
jgi:hypothetical protein